MLVLEVKAASIAQLKARLEDVDYIFIDKLSMLSCYNLYNGQAQLKNH
jgi:hypothetical protein